MHAAGKIKRCAIITHPSCWPLKFIGFETSVIEKCLREHRLSIILSKQNHATMFFLDAFFRTVLALVFHNVGVRARWQRLAGAVIEAAVPLEIPVV